MPRVFAEAYICFIVSASAKKNAKAIEFLGILKRTFPRKKINTFLFFKKRNVLLNKKEKVLPFFT